MGNFTRARSATDLLVQAYDIEKHGHLVHTNNHDPKCGTLTFADHWLYALGYPDRAREAALEQPGSRGAWAIHSICAGLLRMRL